MRILVIDDNQNSLQSLCLVLQDLGHEPIGMNVPTEAYELATTEFFPLIITDIRMPEIDGLTLLSELKNHPLAKASDIVLITGHGDMATAVEALRKGAYDYLNKPINARELSAVVDRCAERQALLHENTTLRNNVEQVISQATKAIQQDLEQVRHRLREVEGIGVVIADSPAMRQLMHEALILHSDPTVAVLIEGETGTGKEVFARYIHHGEGVSDEPFMAINCSAIPHELFESELFGHEAGAFTGSKAEGAAGKLEQAGNGTLFLDEVAEMPLSLQPKLLRVLEERSFYRVGGVKKRSFNARIVCAGNRNMSEMVEKGTFRRDLYHRLRVGHIAIPPLRERKEDIEPLTNHFLQREAIRKKKHFAALAQETREVFSRYPWPGNVRELENTIERAVLMHDGELLLPAHVQFLFQTQPLQSVTGTTTLTAQQNVSHETSSPQTLAIDVTAPESLLLPEHPLNLDEIIDHITQAALTKFNGNKSKAAEYLGISRFALHRRLHGKEKSQKLDTNRA